MTALESIRQKLGVDGSWQQSGGAHWLDAGTNSVRAVAAVMNEARARFVTITAYQLPGDKGFRLEYHWDLDGQLLGIPFSLTGNTIDSIFDLCAAVDWIEREIHEGFAIDFAGRPYEPLQLLPGTKLGVNLRDEVAR
jgi:NADH:ubiquinone oxidoreductase subunit C